MGKKRRQKKTQSVLKKKKMDFFGTILLALSAFGTIFWSLFFIPTYLFGYKLIEIKSNCKIGLVTKNHKYATMYDEDGEPKHFIITSNGGIAFKTITRNERTSFKTMWLLTKDKVLTDELKNASDDASNHNLWFTKGNYFELEYASRRINLGKYDGRNDVIVKKIVKKFNVNKNVSAFISGNVGLGKTSIGYSIAKSFKSSNITLDFDPSEPNNNIDQLYFTINPTKDNPLVIIMDEIDILIENIHHRRIENHKYIPIKVRNKSSFNKLLDNFSSGRYENIILIMTSNHSLSYINKLDISYLRKGRVDLYFDLEKNK